MALASAAMLTITSGIAVMTRPPRVHIDGPATSLPAAEPPRIDERAAVEGIPTIDSAAQRAARIETRRADAQARIDRQPHVSCRVAVHRGNLDGDAQPYDECIVSPDIASRAATGPEAR